MKVLTLVWIERLHELIPKTAAKLVPLLPKGDGGFLMVHTSRLTHRSPLTRSRDEPGAF